MVNTISFSRIRTSVCIIVLEGKSSNYKKSNHEHSPNRPNDFSLRITCLGRTIQSLSTEVAPSMGLCKLPQTLCPGLSPEVGLCLDDLQHVGDGG